MYKIIYSFHMPLFALVSGYFLLFSGCTVCQNVFNDSLSYYAVLLFVLTCAPIASTSVFMYPFCGRILWNRSDMNHKIHVSGQNTA